MVLAIGAPHIVLLPKGVLRASGYQFAVIPKVSRLHDRFSA